MFLSKMVYCKLSPGCLFIFSCAIRQVVQIFHSHITEAFTKLEVSTPQAKDRYADLCILFTKEEQRDHKTPLHSHFLKTNFIASF
jgi:hypothetical protein